MKLFLTTERGRSMIEMLGVLAIVGILSVGGIMGFSKAIIKYRNNRSVEDYIFFINNILLYKDDILKTKTYHLASILYGFGILPDSWNIEGAILYDRLHRKLFPYMPATINIEYRLKNADSTLFSQETEMLCQKLWTDVILPYKEDLFKVYLTNDVDPVHYYFGTQFCKKGLFCLTDVTLTHIIAECSKCTQEERCVLNFIFK